MIQNVIAAPEYQSLKKETLAYEDLEIPKTIPTPCDKEMWLYTFQNDLYRTNQYNKKSWTYIARKIENSNLIFIAVNGLKPVNTTGYVFTPAPTEVEYPTDLSCHILKYNNYTRRNSKVCFKVRTLFINVCFYPKLSRKSNFQSYYEP